MIKIFTKKHCLIYISSHKYGDSYICNKCQCKVDRFNDNGALYIWDTSANDEIAYGYINLITCDEYIIKNIIG